MGLAARNVRGLLTIQNIVEACDDAPDAVFEEMEALVDGSDWDLPLEVLTVDDVRYLLTLQAYYGQQYPYLCNLWGRLRYETRGRSSNPALVAMRDYLEKVASACKQKYETASRLLTSYQELMKEMGQRSI